MDPGSFKNVIKKMYLQRPIGIMFRVFTNGLGDLSSILGRVIPKTQKRVLDASLLNSQHYKVRIKESGAIQGKELRPSLHLNVVAIEKGVFESPSITVGQLLTYV